MSDNPTVILAVPAQQEWQKPAQHYDRVITRYQFKIPNTSQFFNNILQNDEETFDIYGFLLPDFIFANPDALAMVVNRFIKFPEVSLVFGDYAVGEREHYLDPFDYRVQPDNTSIFIRGSLRKNIAFSDNVNMFAEMQMRLTQQGLLSMHVAEKLFEKNA